MLIVDDSDFNLLFLEMMLMQRFNIRADKASDGVEAM